ncbi:translation factor Sua5 [Sinorhizobium glycinis]|uniref:Threonylcarbamoyl-AMP synthase n=1 Tax=Sinorhizobium glycinis TaxID=1472378 RepID=A0A178XTE7_9HYPH|nr:L-threonylcarbamoyladenylate synthase [Sinorhizobium glycinis]OAP38511.1 translation factor Sua5 [Sinorhizobium glycinis]
MIIDVAADPAAGITSAVEALGRGAVIAVPTETVYGLAADATNESSVSKIFDIKQRPSFNPLICHCSDLEMVSEFATLDPVSLRLAERFWPGPMTLVLNSNPGRLPSVTTAGLTTVAIRIPMGFSNGLIRSYGRPLAAPSANISGRVSATTAAHVESEFGDGVPLILDGGPTKIGVESTILRVCENGIELLRPGGLPIELVEHAAGLQVSAPNLSRKVLAPGMLTSHYAPRAMVRLNATRVGPGETLLKFGNAIVPGEGACARVFNLSPEGGLEEFAAKLYATLKEADDAGAESIAIVPIPDEGLGLAINDRLRRAAAPRTLTLGELEQAAVRNKEAR